MKSTGIIRKIDDLGRIVIPIELRRSLNIDTKDSMEIYINEDQIILKKYSPVSACVFCGQDEDVDEFKGKSICPTCKDELKNK